MKNQTSKRLQDNFDKDNKLKSELNYGIADMEAGRELPLDEAYYGNKNSKNSTSS